MSAFSRLFAVLALMLATLIPTAVLSPRSGVNVPKLPHSTTWLRSLNWTGFGLLKMDGDVQDPPCYWLSSRAH